jgi:hypothetical protein
MGAFRIGINMPGAVSAGAYTAGVLDFLIEALDSWYAARELCRSGQGEPVPMHDVSLPVFSGASAGGMCAAIASVMVQGKFDHIHYSGGVSSTAGNTESNQPNRFFESWVNIIDIQELLKADDLKNDRPVVSLLDCTIIDTIAKYALQPGPAMKRPYIPDNLTLFLTLTNLTGIPYALDNQSNDPSLEESVLYHADRLRFETVRGTGTLSDPTAKALPLNNMNDPRWDLLREAAKATGAFPIFLAPREIKRPKTDYLRPPWKSVNRFADKDPDTAISPKWPDDTPDPMVTINVDGGVIDNDPFDLAHDYLASLEPRSDGNQNPREPLKADRAVITVSPFPSQTKFNGHAKYEEEAEVGAALGSLAGALIASSRFFGESLALIVSGEAFSRFMIAPSDTQPDGTQIPGQSALQCGSLGAFGGFFAKEFRRHDYQLGRRNCQQFLRVHFALPEGNPTIKQGFARLSDQQRAAVLGNAKFNVLPPMDSDETRGQKWIPVIPLCGAVTGEEKKPARERIAESKLGEIVDWMYGRFGAVEPRLTQKIAAPLRIPLNAVARFLAFFETDKEKLVEYLRKELGDSAE